MPDLAKTITTPGLQGRIRATMSHAPSFRVDGDLPDALRRRLEELDRVADVREASRATRSVGSDLKPESCRNQR